MCDYFYLLIFSINFYLIRKNYDFRTFVCCLRIIAIGVIICFILLSSWFLISKFDFRHRSSYKNQDLSLCIVSMSLYPPIY